MAIDDDVTRLLDLYPRIFFACHQRHRREPRSGLRISAHQASILDHLDETDGISLTGLAEHMGVTASTMSLGVDRLEEKGLVRRRRDPDDGRRVLLTLTPRGVRMKEAGSVLEPALVRDLLDRLEPTDRARALEGLALLAEAAGESMKDRRSDLESWRRAG